MEVQDLISFLEQNFFGEEEIKMFNIDGETIDFDKNLIASVRKTGGDYCLLEVIESE